MTAIKASTRPGSEGPGGNVIVHVFGRTDVGRTREHNEDSFIVADLSANNATLQPEVRTHVSGSKGSMFMVADGMGGAAAGEIASAMAVDVVLGEMRSAWLPDRATDGETFARAIKRAAAAANQQINAYAASHPEYRGMGTTATIAGLLGDTLFVAQVGDSRAYLVRNGMAQQITKDQSLMQKLIEAGELTEEEAEHSERRNIILQALGPETSIKIDLTHQKLRRGDVLVLCSDGLSGQVTKDEIARIVSQQPDLVEVCEHLIEKANENGGPDNITVIAARFDGTGLDAVGSVDEVGHRVFPLPDTGQTVAAGLERAAANEETGKRAMLRRTTVPLPEGVHAFETPVQGTPVVSVSTSRRKIGMIIALVLLVALVVCAAWFVLHTAKEVAPVASVVSVASP